MSDRLTPPGEGSKAEDRRKNSAIFDPRIDKAIALVLGSVGSIVLAVGTYFVHDMTAKFDGLGAGQAQVAKDVREFKEDLTGKISRLAEDIAVLKDERKELAELKSLVSKLEDRLHSVELRK